MGNMCGKQEEEEEDGEPPVKIPNPMGSSLGSTDPWGAAMGGGGQVSGIRVMQTVIRAAAKFHGKPEGHPKVYYISSYEESGREKQAVAISHASEIPDSYQGVRADDLAPSQEMLDKYHDAKDTKEKHKEYAQEYLALLGSRGLNPSAITDRYDNGTIFVCYDYEEGDDSVCHRHILSELLVATGHAEIQPISQKMPHALAAIRSQIRVESAVGMFARIVDPPGKKKKFFTASYKTSGTDPKAVAVSHATHIPKTYKGKVAKNLAPTEVMLSKYHTKSDDDGHTEYAADYLKMLLQEQQLTPAKIADLYEDGTIFVCFDYEADDDFPDDSICHRTILGELLMTAGVANVTAK